MKVRSCTWVVLCTGMLLFGALCGCSSKKPSTEATQSAVTASPSVGDLIEAAELTYRNSHDVRWDTEGGIPPQCWAASIKALQPIKVYTHRVNVVVVQRAHDGVEEGKYIYIPISSYLPQNGVDGFEFTPNPQQGNMYYTGDGVFDFKRTLKKP